jgi:FtsH-binding integral membrane protein
MRKVARRRILLAWSLAGVPVVFGLFLAISYRLALTRGELPFLDHHEWRWWMAFAVLLFSGIACIFDASSAYLARRSLAVLGYIVVMGITLFLVAFSVSCMQGDCL